MFDLNCRSATLTLIGAAVALAGCEQPADRARVDPERTTPAVTQQELAGGENPSDIAAVTARARISDLKVGSSLGADGAVAVNLGEIRQGTDILASVAVGDVGAGSAVKPIWLADDDRRLGERTETVASGQAFVVFTAPQAASWAVGRYEIEIDLGDELAGSETFEIVAPAQGS